MSKSKIESIILRVARSIFSSGGVCDVHVVESEGSSGDEVLFIRISLIGEMREFDTKKLIELKRAVSLALEREHEDRLPVYSYVAASELGVNRAGCA